MRSTRAGPASSPLEERAQRCVELVGSLIVGLFVELSTLWLPSDMKYVGALVILILVLLFRPQGILGRRERIG